MESANLFGGIPATLPKEITEVLSENQHLRIEKIVSKGHSSPTNFWYDQDDDEWVVLLKGQAALLFEQDGEIVELEPGDYVNIPAHRKHRVHWTSPDTPTIWLAVFYKADADQK